MKSSTMRLLLISPADRMDIPTLISNIFMKLEKFMNPMQIAMRIMTILLDYLRGRRRKQLIIAIRSCLR